MADYHRMSVADKLKAHRARMREEAIRCRECGVQTTVADLARHRATTCQGRPDPHPLSKWVTWKEALAQGVRPGTLSKWVRKGKVRMRGEVWRREYLLRDVVELIAERGGFHVETVSGRKPEEQLDSEPSEEISK